MWYTDADFVDVIHTGALTQIKYQSKLNQLFINNIRSNNLTSDCGTFGNGHYGLKKAIGDADFYPAQGSDQPICRPTTFYKQVRKMEQMLYTKFYRSIQDRSKMFKNLLVLFSINFIGCFW